MARLFQLWNLFMTQSWLIQPINDYTNYNNDRLLISIKITLSANIPTVQRPRMPMLFPKKLKAKMRRLNPNLSKSVHKILRNKSYKIR